MVADAALDYDNQQMIHSAWQPRPCYSSMALSYALLLELACPHSPRKFDETLLLRVCMVSMDTAAVVWARHQVDDDYVVVDDSDYFHYVVAMLF